MARIQRKQINRPTLPRVRNPVAVPIPRASGYDIGKHPDEDEIKKIDVFEKENGRRYYRILLWSDRPELSSTARGIPSYFLLGQDKYIMHIRKGNHGVIEEGGKPRLVKVSRIVKKSGRIHVLLVKLGWGDGSYVALAVTESRYTAHQLKKVKFRVAPA